MQCLATVMIKIVLTTRYWAEVYEEVLLKFVPIVVFNICTQGYDSDIGVR